jgi:outer membrane lipoprotein SlyB
MNDKYLLVERCLTEKEDYKTNRNVKLNRKRLYGRAAGVGATMGAIGGGIAGGAKGAVAGSAISAAGGLAGAGLADAYTSTRKKMARIKAKRKAAARAKNS